MTNSDHDLNRWLGVSDVAGSRGESPPDSKFLKFLRMMARARLGPRSGNPLRRAFSSGDIVHRVLMRFYGRRREFRGRTWPELAAYFSKLVDHETKDAARRARTQKRDVSRLEALSAADAVASAHPSPSSIAGAFEGAGRDADRLRRRIESLPEGLRAVVTLMIEGLDYAEIADRLKIKESAVRQRASRAIRRLRGEESPGSEPDPST